MKNVTDKEILPSKKILKSTSKLENIGKYFKVFFLFITSQIFFFQLSLRTKGHAATGETFFTLLYLFPEGRKWQRN